MDDWIDSNFRLVRMVPWVIGGFGVYLICKKTYMFSHFRSSSSIPLSLVVSNHRLSGRVVTCSGDGLGVWHIPLGHWLLRRKLRPPNNNEGLVRIKFAGLSVNDLQKTEDWLAKNLLNQKIRFVLLDKDEEQVECLVYKANRFRPYNSTINELLILEGLATVGNLPRFHGNQYHASFKAKMIDSEDAAKKRGRGMWEGTGYEKWRWKIWRAMKRLFRFFKSSK